MLAEPVLARVFLMALPLYVANASAMLVGGGTPLDFGLRWRGQPLLGAGKTWRGTAGGFLLGALAAVALEAAAPAFTATLTPHYGVAGAFMAAGAVLGDIAASFLKRRMGMATGHPSLLLDQLDFVAGGLVFLLWAYVPTLLEVALLVTLTLVAHKASNFLAYKWNIKKVPW